MRHFFRILRLRNVSLSYLWFLQRARLFTQRIETSYPLDGKKSRFDRRYDCVNCDQSLIGLG